MGLGNYQSQNSFTFVEALPDQGLVQACASTYHTIVLSSDGDVYGFGYNYYGELGIGNYDTYVPSPAYIGCCYKAVACGEYHSLFLDSNKNLWGTGLNIEGQLGLGDSSFAYYNSLTMLIPNSVQVNPVDSFAAGNYHSIASDIYGNLFTAGSNVYGQLCVGSSIPYEYSWTQVTALADGTTLPNIWTVARYICVLFPPFSLIV